MREESPIFLTFPALSDEAAYNLCEFLNTLSLAIERHYLVQLRRFIKKLEEQNKISHCFNGEDVPF